MRIWFNHWFSTAYRVIEDIQKGCQENNIDIEIIGSNRLDVCVYKTICNEFYIEPDVDISAKDYVNWCLDFCKCHNIDVFIPRREREEISKYLSEFNKLNVKVMVDKNTELLNLLEDKFKTVEFFKKNDICKVPDIIIVNNVEEFKSAYKTLKNKYPQDRICIKYNKDEGATSFRVIDDKVDNITSLRTGTGLKISYNHAVEMLGSVSNFDDLIVMIYLDGPEVSIDSLMTKNGFIGLSRQKVGSRTTKIEYNKSFYEISKKFAEITKITMPYNMQLRYHKNKWYLLEVNTRMAGGTYKSCMTGINIPFIALCELLDIPCEFPNIKKIKKILVSDIETPIIIKGEYL